MKKHKEHHPHLRSYVGQARVQIHSAIRQLENAQAAFGPTNKLLGSSLWNSAIDVEELLDELRPLHEKLTHTHNVLVRALS